MEMLTRRPREAGDSGWSLRAALVAVLFVLLATLMIATVIGPSASVSTGAPRKSTPDLTGARGTAPPVATTSGPPASSTTATVPGAISGPATLPRAAGECGLSFGRQVASAPVGRCKVLEIGDSLGSDLGWGLERQLVAASGLDLIQLDKSASGLANSAFYDWPAQLQLDLQKYHPQLVVASFGGDDEQGMNVGGSAVQFATPSWRAAYMARVRELIGEATASGSYVLWVGLPVMQPPYYNQGVELLDSLFEQTVTSEANASYVSTWTLFSNAVGAFQSDAQVDGGWTTLRQSDGIHYSVAGENVLATYVIREIGLIYHVDVAPANPAVITGL